MERDINLIIEETKQSVINTLNKSNLPISIIYYIMRDLMNETSESYTGYINQAYKKERELSEVASSQNNDVETIVEDN